jgi:6-phosphogluconolactonase
MDTPKREVAVVSDAEAIADTAAKQLISLIAGRAKPAICLTGGSSPRRLYELLAAPPYRDQIAWRRVHWFIGDERFVGLDDPLSNMGMAKRIFLDRCAPANHVHPIATDEATPDAAALRYESELRSFYGADRFDPARPLFDLVLMGLGPDGHTASLFPGASIADRDRWAIGVDTANVAPFVPRVSLTFAALASCRQMLFLVSGPEKRAIFARVQRGDDLPAARARSNVVTTWLVDAAAAGDTL